MSSGIVICSLCKREVHQDGFSTAAPGATVPASGWRHCDDKTPRCTGATTTYPESRDEIVGPYCGRDGDQFAEQAHMTRAERRRRFIHNRGAKP